MQLLFHLCNVKMVFVDVDHFIGNCLYCSILIDRSNCVVLCHICKFNQVPKHCPYKGKKQIVAPYWKSNFLCLVRSFLTHGS